MFPTRWMRSALLVAVVVVIASPTLAADPADDSAVLIEVNGEEIRSDRIDAMIMKSHGRNDMSMAGEELLVRLLDKAVNDALIVQESVAMQLHEEPLLVESVEEAATRVAVREFVRDRYEQPSEVSEEQIKEFFADMYHRIQLRQISLRTREEIVAARVAIGAGADMDALGRERSLDPKAVKGGLHNFVHWADVENTLRDAARGLDVGELSEPFRYRQAWAVVRVEQRADPDWGELETYREFIRGAILSDIQEEAWDDFVAELRAETPVEIHENALERMREDGDLVFRGEFRTGSEDPALVIDDEHLMTEGELRDATGRIALEMGDRGFEPILERSLERQIERLLLRTHAEREGYFEHPKVIEAYDAEMEQALINHYLDETVVSKIRFRRDEFEEFYEENQDRFRGSTEVKVSFLLLGSKDEADEAHRRLLDGADFEYLKEELQGGGHGSDTAKWAPIEMFSPDIVEAVGDMEVGDTSGVLPFNERYMIVRLDGRRGGEVLPLEQVEMQIREAMFQKQFQERLDEQLRLLKERSEIVRHDDRIREYFSAES